MIGKKGLSQVIGTLLMVLITLGLIAALWGPLESFITDKTEKTEACFGIFEDLTMENDYTCFNSTSNETYISISRKNIEIDSILVAISYGDDSFLFRLENKSTTIDGVMNSARGANVQMPKINSGKKYIIPGNIRPVSINIAPMINEEQCESTSTLDSVFICH